ncbi:MAG TPA: tetratricopeptide repeat protein [Rhizomicrobium sp.]|nr:tetratricopeptide repeat protein [Rhizomicrobium sp.]
MTARLASPMKQHHLLAIAGTVLLALIALIWSTRGLGHPNPADERATTPALQRNAATERQYEVTHFSLVCLDALTRGVTKEAVGHCNLALDLDPNNVTLLDLRGNVLVLAGEPQKALADFSHAIALAPTNPEAYRYRGNVSFTLHRDAAALADYNRAVALDPSNAVGLDLRGHFYQSTGAYGLAIADFGRAIALNPAEARAWNSRCWTRVLANTELTAALADCDHALALNPRYASAFDSRGFAHVRLKQFALAIHDFDSALALEPKLASSLFGRGLVKLATGNATAQRDFAMARLLDRNIETRFAAMGFRLRANGPSGA